MRRAFVVLETLAIAALVGGAAWFISADHRVVPGELGCGFVRDSESRWKCRSNYWVQRIDEDGVAPTAAKIEAATRDDQGFSVDCHQTMHIVGRRLSSEKVISVHELPKSLGPCTGGLVHGMMEQIIDTGTTDVDGAGKLVCGDRDSKLSAYGTCYHGIGHALVRKRPKLDVDRCDPISEVVGRRACRNGAFMQLVIDEAHQDPVSWCRDTRTDDRFMCGLYLPNHWLGTTDDDFPQLFQRCARLRPVDVRMQAGCIDGVSAQVVKFGDLKVCANLSRTLRVTCSAGFLMNRSNESGAKEWRMCKRINLDLDGCALGVGLTITGNDSLNSDTEQQLRECSTITGSRSDLCALGVLGCIELSFRALPDARCKGAQYGPFSELRRSPLPEDDVASGPSVRA